jgi:tetratricopeptide (TPR) repeat protein
LVLEWKWPEATAEMERALKLAPGAGVVLRAAGRHATHLGQIDKAIEYFEKAVSLDPLSFSAHVNLGIRYMFANRFDDAERQIRIGLDINPSATVAHFGLANVSLFRGRPREALELVKAERMPHLHRLMGVIAYHTLGEFAKSDAALEDMIANFADTSACEIANAYGWRGETDKAFEWLDRAYRQRDAGLASMLSDPLMRSLHGDARWEPFLKKLGLK